MLRYVKQHARRVGCVILGVLTVYGVYHLTFDTPNLAEVMARWETMGFWVLVALALAVIDCTLEAVCWVWLYGRFRMPVRDGLGLSVYLSGHAGLFIPAQMGRIIRPDAMARLGRGSLSDGIKAEAALLFFDTTAALVLVTSLAFLWIQPLAIPVVALSVSVVMLFLADRVTSLLSGTRLSLPTNFWLTRQMFAILSLMIVGWMLNGLALYALVWDLAEGVSALEVIFFGSLSRLAGSGTGLPGGIGVTEGLLGVSLGVMDIPVEHLILAVVAYRILTFWLLLPIGWFALLFVNRYARKKEYPLKAELQTALT